MKEGLQNLITTTNHFQSIFKIMNKFKIIFFFLAIIATGAFISSCGNSSQNQEHAVHGEGKEYTSAYVCPMHCEGSGSDAEGKCPVCGMDYVMQSEHVKDGHKH